MPIIKSAAKRMRQDERRYAQNLRTKRAVKIASKKFMDKPTFKALCELQSEIDTAVKKNVINKNTGSRQMKKYSSIAKEAGVKIPAKKAVTKKDPVKKATATKKPAAKK